MSWLRSIGRKLSGAEAREREAERVRLAAEASRILAEHEARDHFSPDEALKRLQDILGEQPGIDAYSAHCGPKISSVVTAALADGLLTPDEEARIEATRQRYGGPQIDAVAQGKIDAARAQYAAWNTPLAPVQTPLLLKKGEWCAHAVRAEALEQRQRTVRVNYHGGTARVRIAKGLYYAAGSVTADRVSEAYNHSFGVGVLGATNTRLLWVSPEKSIAIPLSKIVMFEPYRDGIKVIKDTGKPLLFVFEKDDPASMVRISRVTEELRS